MGILIIGVILLFILTMLPSLWTKHILKKYNQPHPDIPGTGLQFAEHLVKKLKLQGVTIEETEQMINIYAEFAEKFMAMPVIIGAKTEQYGTPTNTHVILGTMCCSNTTESTYVFS